MNLYDFTVQNASGKNVSLRELAFGKVVIIVNVASKCGFTPQYKALENLYQTYKDQGLLILGFPCNQFGAQESGSNEEIQSFCELNFGVTFPVLAKIDVNGKSASELYQWLKKERRGLLGTQGIKWNFTKFIIDRNGNCVSRHSPNTEPKDLESSIKNLL